MRILIFTYSMSRMAGGLFAAVRDLFTNVTFKETELKIFTFWDKYSQEDISQWKGIPICFFKPHMFLFSSKAKKKILHERSEILHMEGLWRYPQFYMSIWKNKKKPIVCSPHGMLDPYIISKQGKVKRIIAKMFFQKSLNDVTCYHALCKKELDDIRAYGLKQPIAVIPNGINIGSPHTYKKDNSKKHLLYLGRLHKKKGIDLLIWAIERINREEPEMMKTWIVDIVGWDDEGLLCRLKKMVNKYGLEEIIIFHGGLFNEDKEKMYALSDAYILPSHGEGLPMTVLEAWAWRLPVLMTSKCNIPEGFEANAAIYIEDSVNSIQRGVLRLFRMSDVERNKMGERGYMLVKEKFTWDSSAKKMRTLYEWILGNAEKPEFVYE